MHTKKDRIIRPFLYKYPYFDILPRINPWDSLDYNNITTPYRSGYSMIFQDLASVGVPHLWMVLPGSWADAGAHFSILKSKTLFHG